MTAGSRLTITALPVALAAGLFAPPLAAQNSTQPAPAPAPASNGVIGPSELRDFNLKGTVNRAAPPLVVPPVSDQAQPPVDRVAPPTTTLPQTTLPTSTPAPQQVSRAPAPAARSSSPGSDAKPSSSVTFSLPSADSATPEPGVETDTPPNLGSQPGLVPVEPPASASIAVNSGPMLWPWLLAAVAAGLAVLFYGIRQRSRQAVPAGAPMAFSAPEPDLAAVPLSRVPSPPIRPAAVSPPQAPISSKIPGMIVSTRLRPSLDVQFMPERLIVDLERVTIQFAAIVLNSGNAPARDVLVEAAMFNAGITQDEEIGAFFAHPAARGERIAEIPPLKTLTLRSAVVLPLNQIRIFEVEGRKLFVPLVGFNALYRWSGKDVQTSESYIVGIDTQADRMAPFRFDGEPRQFRNLAARAHTARLRK